MTVGGRVGGRVVRNCGGRCRASRFIRGRGEPRTTSLRQDVNRCLSGLDAGLVKLHAPGSSARVRCAPIHSILPSASTNKSRTGLSKSCRLRGYKLLQEIWQGCSQRV